MPFGDKVSSFNPNIPKITEKFNKNRPVSTSEGELKKNIHVKNKNNIRFSLQI